ncbi:MAG: leucine dehydrogenase [Deltaproteobacteria bacterium GWA2_38_16]|nr:MAG: leucine dehydrogenase [Deltaproteobacteria bacterium GWA2_38_16]OGQ02504.1 MAG: leucine dehydrogenase [Deltaproteobacteria bacterium RIFCSPHIGHO2_02_FULL_38_15]OGQ33204.1 MAG: leucine dehydrogenase [Deltaproteobacteria bacterium RIFCSPLOWO2_01_FULL_38_9]OGQ60905.1 MAG: leucine dehydrogenase [Deltaproteobacteria bacterium RIFCSPLOWO2_12_FULL_38_8]HBQ21041.1 leucine dehydrogenase [Deltaproteobacteria bacterium]
MSFNFELMKKMGHEQVIFCHNPNVGLKAIIAIHNTALGPALGGTRMWPYKTEEEAFEDALRLSRGMTYKSAVASLNFGGGKAVIIGDPKKDKSESLFRAFGAFVERLKGQFITGEDVGIDVNDIEFMFMETDFVTGLSKAHGGSGDPSPMTAYGVIQGMQACIEKRLKQKGLKGLTVAVQGLGHVGEKLIEYLVHEGAKVIGCDIDPKLCEMVKSKFNMTIVESEKIYGVDCDIFAPCALGGVLNEQTIPQLKCSIVAGSANNQLQKDSDGELLQKKGILYAPDYVINAGGLINVALELEGYSENRAKLLTRNIYYNLKRAFEISEEQKILPHVSADRLAEERIKKVGFIKRSHVLHKSQIRRKN